MFREKECLSEEGEEKKQYPNSIISNQDIKCAFDKNEFDIYYQPKVCKNNKVVGVEALARWTSPKYGNVCPEYFISIMEKSSFIIDFQKYILQKSIKEIITFNKENNTSLSVSINIWPKQIEDDSFIEYVHMLIRDYKVDACLIEFEITEKYPLHKVKDITERLNRLKNIGIKISLDDFGKGYNSLRYLTQFKFDTVKIDKSYIDLVENNPKLIYGLIEIIHSVNSSVVLEGIENKNQADIINKLGGDIGQGYYFSRPIMLNNLLSMIKKYH